MNGTLRELFNTIRGKMLLLVLLNVAGFALIIAIVGVSNWRLKSLTTEVVEMQTAQLTESANIARELSDLFAEIELFDRAFYGRDDVFDARRQTLVRLAGQVSGHATGPELAAALKTMTARLGAYLEAGGKVNAVLAERRALASQIWTEISGLEEQLSQWLIELTLKGEDTDPIDQILALVTGYRESLLIIERRHAESYAAYAERRALSEGVEVLAMVDDLHRRLQTITASAPEIASHGKMIAELTARYRSAADGLYLGLSDLGAHRDGLETAKTAAISVSVDLDRVAAGVAAQSRARMDEIFLTSRMTAVALSIAVVALIGLSSSAATSRRRWSV